MTKKILEVSIRGSKKFKDELHEVIRDRYADIDKNMAKPMGTSRVTELITKMPEWPSLKARLKLIPKKEDIK